MSQLRTLNISNRFSQQRMQLSLDAGARHIGHCEVDPTQIIQEFARAGAVYLRKLLDKDIHPQENEVVHTTAAATNVNNLDSFLGSQGTNETMSEKQQHETQDEALEVVVSSSHVRPEASSPPVKCFTPHVLKEKERGIKNMIIELDEEAIAQNPELEDEVRARYPWATIQSKAGPSPSEKRLAQPAEANPTVPKKLDVIKHLGDLFEYAKEPPTVSEFDNYAQAGWDALPYTRKLEIAHACAIQGAYGKMAEGHTCSHCNEQNYQCRVYIPQLRNLTHMNFGPSCQHCRLKGVSCSFAAATKDRIPSTPSKPLSAGLRLDTVDLTIDPSCDTSNTPSTTANRKPSLASRMTPINPNLPVQSWTDTDSDSDDNSGLLFDKDAKVGDSGTPQITLPTSPILRFAESIGLPVPSHVGKVIHAMYTYLRQYREVRAYAPRSLKLEHYYSNLVTLYVLADREGETELAYIVLLRFQNTNYNWIGTMPSIEAAIQAFEYLPEDTPLCRWFAILYSYLWGTVDEGDYRQFTKAHPELDPTALSKLLYAVAYTRDRFTKGHDVAVLARWCDVHDHDDDTWQDRHCRQMHSALKMSPEDAKTREETRVLHEAQATIDFLRSVDTRARESVQDVPFRKCKIRAECSPERSHKKTKRGGGSFGSGR
jgi:hypothetical protein